MKILIQNPGKREHENRYRSYFIFRKQITKIPIGIITIPLDMENSSWKNWSSIRGLWRRWYDHDILYT